MVKKIRTRLTGLPRTVQEMQRSLSLLATLRALGWHASVRAGVPLDKHGNPLPFYNYAAIEWLARRIRPGDRVFEFGCGYSTLWFARRVTAVVAVDHDPVWAARVRRLAPKNTEVIVATHNYADTIRQFASTRFDVIVIDGIDRERCAETAPPYLASDGVIILDNSDRPQLARVLDRLEAADFGRIDLSGVIPGYADLTTTSIFLRDSARWLRGSPPRFLGGYIPPEV